MVGGFVSISTSEGCRLSSLDITFTVISHMNSCSRACVMVILLAGLKVSIFCNKSRAFLPASL